MLGMAPDYDHLTVIQKVEVFEHALESTSGAPTPGADQALPGPPRTWRPKELPCPAWLRSCELLINSSVMKMTCSRCMFCPLCVRSPIPHECASTGTLALGSGKAEQAGGCRAWQWGDASDGRARRRGRAQGALAEVAQQRGVAGAAHHLHALLRRHEHGSLPARLPYHGTLDPKICMRSCDVMSMVASRRACRTLCDSTACSGCTETYASRRRCQVIEQVLRRPELYTRSMSLTASTLPHCALLHRLEAVKPR